MKNENAAGCGTKKQFKVAVIGCGRISVMHFDGIARSPLAQLVACCDLPAEQRIIHLQLRKQYRSLFYRLKNPYSDTSRGIRIGEYHGYGLKNINRIVQENHGDFYTKKKDGVFTVQVRLNCEN